MKYIKSSGGYYYKELSNGKRSRVSAEEYNTKKQKFQNEQDGGRKIEKRELKSEVKDNLKLNKKINKNFKDIKNKQEKFDIVISKIDKDLNDINNDISKSSNSNNYKEDIIKIEERKEKLSELHKKNNDKKTEFERQEQLKQKARNLKSEAKKDLEKQNKEKKEQIRQRQGIADELATLILEI